MRLALAVLLGSMPLAGHGAGLPRAYQPLSPFVGRWAGKQKCASGSLDVAVVVSAKMPMTASYAAKGGGRKESGRATITETGSKRKFRFHVPLAMGELKGSADGDVVVSEDGTSAVFKNDPNPLGLRVEGRMALGKGLQTATYRFTYLWLTFQDDCSGQLDRKRK